MLRCLRKTDALKDSTVSSLLVVVRLSRRNSSLADSILGAAFLLIDFQKKK